jgi:hypothetical protein
MSGHDQPKRPVTVLRNPQFCADVGIKVLTVEL